MRRQLRNLDVLDRTTSSRLVATIATKKKRRLGRCRVQTDPSCLCTGCPCPPACLSHIQIECFDDYWCFQRGKEGGGSIPMTPSLRSCRRRDPRAEEVVVTIDGHAVERETHTHTHRWPPSPSCVWRDTAGDSDALQPHLLAVRPCSSLICLYVSTASSTTTKGSKQQMKQEETTTSLVSASLGELGSHNALRVNRALLALCDLAIVSFFFVETQCSLVMLLLLLFLLPPPSSPISYHSPLPIPSHPRPW